LDLTLNPDQSFFQETTRRFLEGEAPLTRVRELADDPAGFDRGWWRRGAELGWTAFLVPGEHGGGTLSGGGLADLAIVAEEFGRMVSPGPLHPANVVAGALAASGTPEQQAEVLPGIVSGDLVATAVGDRATSSSRRGTAGTGSCSRGPRRWSRPPVRPSGSWSAPGRTVAATGSSSSSCRTTLPGSP
jgi:alkylation response protein AidB-like acyl-CoA dehydrogenase